VHYQNERTSGCRISDAWTYRGLKTVVMENEVLRVSILADKGADIFELVHKPTDTDFMWRTPWSVRDVTKWVPSTGWGAGVWHDAYIGGWQTIAPTGGPPQTYAGADVGQHTEATLMPWDTQILEDTPERVSVKFWVRTVRTPFWIEKTLTLESGSAVLTVEDSITNEAEEPAEVEWGQHVAIGEPFLTPDCILDLPKADHFAPREAEESGKLRIKPGTTGQWPYATGANGTQVDLRKIPAKTERLADYMVFKNMSAGWYAVTNPQRGVGIGVTWPVETFKYLWYWQVFGGGNGYPWYGRTYNVGLEPFTSLSAGVPEPGSNKRTALTFGPGETRKATVKAVVYNSTTGVESIGQDGAVKVRG
jgi:hypothetical protein